MRVIGQMSGQSNEGGGILGLLAECTVLLSSRFLLGAASQV